MSTATPAPKLHTLYGREASFMVPFAPVAQPRARHGQGRTYQAAKGHPIYTFKACVRMFAKKAGFEMFQFVPLRVDVTFVFPRPKTIRRNGRTARVPVVGPRIVKATVPDRDNLDKAVLDALKGIAWTDDGQVADGRLRKFYAASGEQPHVAVRIREIFE